MADKANTNSPPTAAPETPDRPIPQRSFPKPRYDVMSADDVFYYISRDAERDNPLPAPSKKMSACVDDKKTTTPPKEEKLKGGGENPISELKLRGGCSPCDDDGYHSDAE